MRVLLRIAAAVAICVAATQCQAQSIQIHFSMPHDFYPGQIGVSIIPPTTYDVVYDVPNPYYDPFAFGSTEPEFVDVAMVATFTVTNGTDSYPLHHYLFCGPDPSDPTLWPGAPPDDPTIDDFCYDIIIVDPDSSDDDFLIMSDSYADLGWD